MLLVGLMRVMVNNCPHMNLHTTCGYLRLPSTYSSSVYTLYATYNKWNNGLNRKLNTNKIKIMSLLHYNSRPPISDEILVQSCHFVLLITVFISFGNWTLSPLAHSITKFYWLLFCSWFTAGFKNKDVHAINWRIITLVFNLFSSTFSSFLTFLIRVVKDKDWNFIVVRYRRMRYDM